MGCFDDLLIFFLSTMVIMLVYSFKTAQSTHIRHFCLGSRNYTANSEYQTNLNHLLSSLYSSNSTNLMTKNGYYNATVGQSPNIVYGSFQCRGDIPLEECQQECVGNATKEITYRWCPNSKEAMVWYHKCMLRYSNRPYFAVMEDQPSNISISNHNNNTNPDQFNRKLAELVDVLVRQAVSGSPNYNTLFATGERYYSTMSDDDDDKIYALVQCTSDISQSDCQTCLRGVNADIKRYCYGKRGAELVRPSCYLRYDTNSFYPSNITVVAGSLSPPSGINTTVITNTKRKISSKLVLVIIVVPSIIITVLLLSTITIWYFYYRRTKEAKKSDDVEEIRNAESFQFHFSTIRAATDNFSDANKLGQGGFGYVYKGTLSDGQDIAVKRLSRNSGQGEEEFKNEVALVVKLQHRNLVRLLGFCLDGEERLLIYEFLSNASLDQFIFDPSKRTYLDWERRYKIIEGIARGLLYLHEDSRLRIIHRDLKASNVLLSADMNPKISDFGMARSFMLDQTQASTNRIVGTYGYMAPEYAMHGHFSVKSDVFSFGVLVLEIISGRRNNSFYEVEAVQDLLCYAWRYWKNGTALELLDPTLRERCSINEVMRCIHIGLLCVQDDVTERPTMSSVILKLNNHSDSLPLPSSPPGIFVHSRSESTMALDSDENFTVSDESITEMYPR